MKLVFWKKSSIRYFPEHKFFSNISTCTYIVKRGARYDVGIKE